MNAATQDGSWPFCSQPKTGCQHTATRVSMVSCPSCLGKRNTTRKQNQLQTPPPTPKSWDEASNSWCKAAMHVNRQRPRHDQSLRAHAAHQGRHVWVRLQLRFSHLHVFSRGTSHLQSVCLRGACTNVCKACTPHACCRHVKARHELQL